MEVLLISAWFIAIVAAAMAFCGYLVGQALSRDRQYQLAIGELSLAPAEPVVEEEPPPILEPVEPVGTLALLLVYLMVLIGLWLAMFAILLERS